MMSQMCVRSFVTFRCVLTKPYAFFEHGNNNNKNNNRRGDQGRLPASKNKTNKVKMNKVPGIDSVGSSMLTELSDAQMESAILLLICSINR